MLYHQACSYAPQGRGHTRHGQKHFQETRHALSKGWHAPGLKNVHTFVEIGLLFPKMQSGCDVYTH